MQHSACRMLTLNILWQILPFYIIYMWCKMHMAVPPRVKCWSWLSQSTFSIIAQHTYQTLDIQKKETLDRFFFPPRVVMLKVWQKKEKRLYFYFHSRVYIYISACVKMLRIWLKHNNNFKYIAILFLKSATKLKTGFFILW